MPDRTAVVLDTAHGALHFVSPTGVPVGVVTLPAPLAPGGACRPARMDVGVDGLIRVIGTCASDGADPTGWLAVVDPQGTAEQSVALDLPYSDVAVAPDGRVLLSRTRPVVAPTPEPRQPRRRPPGGVDVLGPTLTLQYRIDHPSLAAAVSVDVAPDGTIYVANRVPSPWDYDRPAPVATPPPALLGFAQVEPAVEGVVVFDADYAYRETVPFTTPEDVVAGPAGVFVSRNVEVFRLGHAEPLYAGPPGQLVIGALDGVILHLDAPARGGLRLSMAHCYFQGLLEFQPPVDGVPPRLWGELDRPDLAGPVNPARIAAGDGLALLQDRFAAVGQWPQRRHVAHPAAPLPQTVQRWTAAGRLDHQLGICAGSMSGWLADRGSAHWVGDVALDGTAVYTVDPDLVRRRPDAGFPEWSYWPGAEAPPEVRSRLTAVAAADGMVAVLDAGTLEVVILRADGTVFSRWGLAAGPERALPTDIALRDGTVWVAEAARHRISAYDLHGRPRLNVTTHEAPWRIDAAADGGVIMLGRGGWALHYAADGALLASWVMPDPAARAVDLAAADDGRVYVAFVTREPADDVAEGPAHGLGPAGAWVFQPEARPIVPEQVPGSCVVWPDKVADPAGVRLGDEVTVTLTLAGRCPGRADAAQVALLLDTSRSMNWNGALHRAKQLALAVLEGLDPRAAEVTLVTFDDEAAVHMPLTRDLASVAMRLNALDAWGDTRLAPGLVAAVSELDGERGRPSGPRLVVIVSDGEFTDQARDAALDARSRGIELLAVALPHGGLSSYYDALLALTGDRRRVLVDPEPAELTLQARALAGFRDEAGLFASVTVEDALPANMRYVPGSAAPPAREVAGALAWSFTDVPAGEALVMQARLRPLELGVWPTNSRAVATYRDAFGEDGVLEFPVPRVLVWDMSTLTRRAYLPLAARAACFRSRQAVDVVLAVDASESMAGPAETGGTKLQAARDAAVGFVGLLRMPADHVAVVAFHERATVLAPLAGDRGVVERALSDMSTAPGTRVDRALDVAGDLLERSRRPDAQPVIVLLSDGLHPGPPEPVLQRAVALRERGVLVFTIGLGADVDEELLKRVAHEPRAYYRSPGAADLAAIYRSVLQSLACALAVR